MVTGLWVYLAYSLWTLKISPVVHGLRVYLKIGPFGFFWYENALLEGFGGFG